MIRKIIKMNENNEYLSLGNLVSIIKEVALNKACAMQSEIFCALFDAKDVNNTTINNYCIGYRAIGIEYKKYYIEKEQQYINDNNCYLDIIIRIISILEDKVILLNDNSFDYVQNNKLLKQVNDKLIKLMNNDNNITNSFKKEIIKNKDNNYDTFVKLLNYAILDNKQPIFINKTIIINQKDLDEYLNLTNIEGTNHILGLQELANKDNVYACAELGSLEFSGFVSGKVDYDKSFEYYYKSALKNHPKGCWMVADLILTKKHGDIKKDFKIAWNYLNKAIELNSVAALNTMGNCYLNGINPDGIKDEQMALKYYLKASEYGYVYAYNNIGLYYERHNNTEEALKYFDLSASLKESWALNKIGEYHRKNGNDKEAFFYYIESSNCPISLRNNYSLYNLAKYYYLNGNEKAGIKKDVNLAIKYLNIAASSGIKKAKELLERL